MQDTTTRPVVGLVPGSFLLTVGRLNVRKNLERTILGAIASGRVSPEVPLVVVGGPSRLSDQLDERVEAAVRAGSVRFSGHVDDAELRWLYRSTRLFLFLSLGEGFGMPPIEARVFGAPVLASDIPVMRENLGSEATFVDPTDIAAIATSIAAALDTDRPGTSALDVLHDWGTTVSAMRESLSRITRA